VTREPQTALRTEACPICGRRPNSHMREYMNGRPRAGFESVVRSEVASALTRYLTEEPQGSTFRGLNGYMPDGSYAGDYAEGWLDFNNAVIDAISAAEIRGWNAALQAVEEAVKPLAVWDKRDVPGGYHVKRADVLSRIAALRKGA
jgi:hypothetical protein